MILKVLSKPVVVLTDHLHCAVNFQRLHHINGLKPWMHKLIVFVRHKRTHHTAIGLILMYCGSFMATHVPHEMPHVVWDMAAYGLHGFGAAPVVKLICDALSIEV